MSNYYGQRIVAIAHDIADGIAADGGATIAADGGPVPTAGYMVSTPDHEYVTVAAGLEAEEVARWLDSRDAFGYAATHNAYLGGWADDDGLAYLDVSVHVADRDDALARARTWRQVASYSLATGESIYV